MALESTWTGLETGRRISPDGGHLVLGGRSGLRVFPHGEIPVGLEVGIVLRRSWDLMNEQCLDCSGGYSDGINHGAVTLGGSSPLAVCRRDDTGLFYGVAFRR